jgi:peptidoglycan/LPS O-acetylase OafA/YrhL
VSTALGRRLIVATLVLIVCDVIGGFIAVSAGVNTWGEAWGFNAKGTVPLPVGAVQFVLAWLAARNMRPPVGLVAAIVLSAFCLISVLFGLFDGDLVDQAGSAPWGFVWGVVLLVVTAVVGLLAIARARQLYRPRPVGE